MAIRKIARMGHPVLRQKARALTQEEIASPEIRRLVQDMVETMADVGGIGLAAPQIHESIQLAIIGFESDNSRYPEMGSQPLSVFINPEITVLDSTTQSFWEGCLSVPELRGLVHRPRKVQVDYLDLEGKAQSVTAEGFLATVFQHELDHLAGVLYVDRVQSTPGSTPLAFTEEYQRFIVPQKPESEDELGE